MGSKERRDREREELRKKILDAARELFARDGYEAVTMRKLAQKIEYSPTALYLHFKDKVALMRELCATDFLQFAKVFNRVARHPDPVVRLRKVGHAYLAFGQEHPNHYRLLFMTQRPPETDENLEGIEDGNPEQDAYAFLKSVVQDAVAAGRLKPAYGDVDQVAQLLWSGMHGLLSLYLTMGEGSGVGWRPLKKNADMMMDLLFAGLLRA